MFYGAVVWDPWLIVAQIVCLQCMYYITLGLLLAVLVGTRVSRLSLVYFFDYVMLLPLPLLVGAFVLHFCSAQLQEEGFSGGILSCYSHIWFVKAVYMLYLIERSKKCLDFAATIYIIHLCICIVYGGWPSSIAWWIVNGTGIALMALLGEYLCIRRELREIPIPRYRSSKNYFFLGVWLTNLTCAI
ncbi:hypothetical protein MtrunA17_Chr1g0173051 [Medicago truncatula]|uniref:Protein SYS1 homolog n=1 Tax=Medicago truncatula TaxID=3880 RepID=A0A396JPF0_MEDTR|nr:hypothetical protein MtrunA17_Chr1g0173051 [Medicago truncatula]